MESLTGGNRKTGKDENWATGQFATTQQGRALENEEGAEEDLAITERNESLGQGVRRANLDEDLSLNTNEDPQGHGEKPAMGKNQETKPEPKQERSYGGAFSPSELKSKHRDL